MNNLLKGQDWDTEAKDNTISYMMSLGLSLMAKEKLSGKEEQELESIIDMLDNFNIDLIEEHIKVTYPNAETFSCS